MSISAIKYVLRDFINVLVVRLTSTGFKMAVLLIEKALPFAFRKSSVRKGPEI